MKKIMYFVSVCFLMVTSINSSAALINCREMNKMVTIKECNAFKNEKRDKERAAKLEERKQKDAARAAKGEQERAIQMEERKKRDAEREEQRAKQREEQQAKEAQELDQRKLRDTEKAAKKEQEMLAREEAQKKRDAERVKQRENKKTLETKKTDNSSASDKSANKTDQSIPNFNAKVDSFVNNWNSKPVDYDGAYGFQCVDLMRRYASDVLNMNNQFPAGNAYNIFNGMQSNKNLRKVYFGQGDFPEKGDVIFWDSKIYGPAGHVSIVISSSSASFISLDQNFCKGALGNGAGDCAPRKVRHDYSGVLGWIATN